MPSFTKIQLGMEDIQFARINCGKKWNFGDFYPLSGCKKSHKAISKQQTQAVLIFHRTSQNNDKFEEN